MKLLEEARSARQKASLSRARHGLRNANEMDQVSVTGVLDSTSTAISKGTTQDSLASETNVPRDSNNQKAILQQPYNQEQPIARPPKTCAASPATPPAPPAATADVSTSAMEVNNMDQRHWRLIHQNTIPGFSTDGIGEAMSDPDFVMIDGDFSVEEFEDFQDLSFLDKII